MDDNERRKIKQLMKEKGEGKDGNMDWMYKQSKPESEDYLLGKRVDKHIEEAVETVKDDDIALFNERIKANIQLDMQNKAREDPLFAIRKREEDAKKRLLENPVKMKQLQKNLEKQKKKAKKKHKSHGGSDDSDDDLMKKYLNILNEKQEKGKADKHTGKRKHTQDYQEHDWNSRKEREFENKGREDSFHHRDSRPQKKYQDRESGEYRRSSSSRQNRDSRDDRHYSKESRYQDSSDRARDYRKESLGRSYQRYEGYDRRRDQDRRPQQSNDSDSDHSCRGKTSHRQRKYSSDSDSDVQDRKKEKDNYKSKKRGKSNGEIDDRHRQRARKDEQDSSDSESKEAPRSKGRQSRQGRQHSSSDRKTDVKLGRSSDKTRAKRKDSFDSSESSESDTEVVSQNRTKKNVGPQQHRHDSSDSDDSPPAKRNKPQYKKSESSSSSSSDSDSEIEKRPVKQYGLIKLKNRDPSPAKASHKSPEQRKGEDRKKSRSPDVRRNDKYSRSERSSPRSRSGIKSLRDRSRSPVRRKLTEDEKKRRLEEMMENAQWREGQRKSNVKRYIEEDKKEEEALRSKEQAEFLNPLMSSHAEKSSVADRLKRNKYNLQRGSGDMDRGFLKK